MAYEIRRHRVVRSRSRSGGRKKVVRRRSVRKVRKLPPRDSKGRFMKRR